MVSITLHADTVLYTTGSITPSVTHVLIQAQFSPGSPPPKQNTPNIWLPVFSLFWLTSQLGCGESQTSFKEA